MAELTPVVLSQLKSYLFDAEGIGMPDPVSVVNSPISSIFAIKTDQTTQESRSSTTSSIKTLGNGSDPTTNPTGPSNSVGRTSSIIDPYQIINHARPINPLPGEIGSTNFPTNTTVNFIKLNQRSREASSESEQREMEHLSEKELASSGINGSETRTRKAAAKTIATPSPTWNINSTNTRSVVTTIRKRNNGWATDSGQPVFQTNTVDYFHHNWDLYTINDQGIVHRGKTAITNTPNLLQAVSFDGDILGLGEDHKLYRFEDNGDTWTGQPVSWAPSNINWLSVSGDNQLLWLTTNIGGCLYRKRNDGDPLLVEQNNQKDERRRYMHNDYLRLNFPIIHVNGKDITPLPGAAAADFVDETRIAATADTRVREMRIYHDQPIYYYG